MDVSEETAAAFHCCPPKYWHLYSMHHGFPPPQDGQGRENITSEET